MADTNILVINGGSSSIKYALYDQKTLTCHRREKVEISQDTYHENIEHILAQTGNIAAVGHRVVHGGKDFNAPTKITPDIAARLHDFSPMAPLHQPYNLKAIDLLLQNHPELTQVACFDTAFHHTQPTLHRLYALPRSMSDEGILRYGFHGLSYEYIASVLPDHTDKADGKVVILHLGSGASACALNNQKSVASTMGFTALEGLMMATRCGDLDPGILLYLMEEKNMPAQEITFLLYTQSGLLGVSGQSGDIRKLMNSANPHAQEAIDLFCHYAVKAVGQLAATLQGLDVLVFTAGIGENQPDIRRRITQALDWLSPETLVIPTNEEYMIARHTAALI